MNTPQEQQASDSAQASAPSPLSTGESQIGVVRRPGAAAAAPEAESPVLEHSVAVPEVPAEPIAAEPQPEPPPEPQALPAPAAPLVHVRAAAALQESPKVSIPERMNHLSTENQRLRDEIQTLEQSLKLKPE